MTWWQSFIEDPKQKLRLRRTSLALIGALAHQVISIIFYYEHLFRLTLSEFIGLFVVFWLINLSFVVLIVSGVNKKFKDPSMTMAQMMWAILCLMITIYFIDYLRDLILMFSFLALMFGGFRLTARQFTFMVCYMILSYALVIVLLYLTPSARIDLKEELIALGMYAFVTLSYLVVCLEYSGLRSHMRGKEDVLQIALAQAKTDSITDVVTGVKNRRYIMSILDRQRIMVSREQNYYFSVLMIDVDHFKNINDTYGHSIGDLVLVQLCKIFEGIIRKVDYFGRIGGEEFLMIAPFTHAEHTQAAAERFRKTIEDADFKDIIPNLKLTISIGVTEYVFPEKISDLLKRVDTALYVAKKNGRNQVIVM